MPSVASLGRWQPEQCSSTDVAGNRTSTHQRSTEETRPGSFLIANDATTLETIANQLMLRRLTLACTTAWSGTLNNERLVPIERTW